MRKVFKFLLGLFLIYWAIAGIGLALIYIFKGGQLTRYILTTAIQLFSGLATFSAVVVSLFSKSIKRHFDKPSLSLECGFDAVHTSHITNPDSAMSRLNSRELEVYVSVKNASVVEALDCQLVCVKAFASEDGENFVFLQNYRAASFRWLYSSDQNRFLTTLRRSVEKYAKIIKLVDQEVENESETKPNNTEAKKGITSSKSREMHFEICLALNVDGHPAISIDPRFKIILISLCLASSNTEPKPYYLLIHNKAVNLERFPTRDAIEIRLVNKDDATRMVAVSLD